MERSVVQIHPCRPILCKQSLILEAFLFYHEREHHSILATMFSFNICFHRICCDLRHDCGRRTDELMGDYLLKKDGPRKKFAGNGFAGGVEVYHHTYTLPAGMSELAEVRGALIPVMFSG